MNLLVFLLACFTPLLTLLLAVVANLAYTVITKERKP